MMEDGYYHVKYFGEWIVAESYGGQWYLTTDIEGAVDSSVFDEIGPKIDPPQEKEL